MLRALHGAIQRRLAAVETYGPLFRSIGVDEAEPEVTTHPLLGHDAVEAFARSMVDLSTEAIGALRLRARRVSDEICGHMGSHPALIGAAPAGSVAMGSALRPVSAVDVAIYLRPDAAPERGTDVRDWAATILRHAGLAPGVHPSTGDLILHTSSGGPDVHVFPIVIEDPARAFGSVFLGGSEEPVFTSLQEHVQYFRRLNRLHEGHFGRIVRLVRWWARGDAVLHAKLRFDSLAVALLCARVAREYGTMIDYPGALARVFALVSRWHVRDGILYETRGDAAAPVELLDPANPANNLAAGYTETEVAALAAAAEDSLDAVTEAYYATNRRTSLKFWRYLLGPSFNG